MATVYFREYEWDGAKAASNAVKHGVTFEEATTVFDSAIVATKDDPTNLANTITIGFDARTRLLTVVTTERTRTRIISARRATKQEAREFTEETGR